MTCTHVDLAEGFLRKLWEDLRDDAGAEALARARASVRALNAAAVVPNDRTELWLWRFQESCPGHRGEGGRRWCAYCGDLPAETEGE